MGEYALTKRLLPAEDGSDPAGGEVDGREGNGAQQQLAEDGTDQCGSGLGSGQTATGRSDQGSAALPLPIDFER